MGGNDMHSRVRFDKKSRTGMGCNDKHSRVYGLIDSVGYGWMNIVG